MARPTGKVMLSIGLLNIPVRIYTATREHDTKFRMLCPECQKPPNRRYWCPHHEDFIEQRDLIRAIPSGEEFIPVSEDELTALPLPSAGAVHVEGFMEAAGLPSIRRQKVNYLGPDRGGEKGYSLLHRALADTAQVAIGKVALRGNEQLVAVEPGPAGILQLTTLFWADEVVEPNPTEFGVDEIALKDQEVELATTLVQGLVLSTNLDAILDESEEALRELLDAKAAGQVIASVEKQATEPPDMMDALREMIRRAKAGEQLVGA